MKPLLSASILAALPLAAAAAEERPQDRWNLADMYADTAAWSADYAKVEAQLKEFAKCKGKLGSSAKRFRECLDLEYDAIKRANRLGPHSGGWESENTGDPARQSLNQKAQIVFTKVGEETAFVAPEILAIGKAKIDGFFKAEPGLKAYGQPVDDVLRPGAHTLDAKGEGLLASFGLIQGTAGSVYRILANSDMPWPTVKLADGKEVRLNQSAYTKARESSNRDDRKKVMDAFFGKFKEFESTLGTTFYSSLKEDSVYAKVRKYPDSMTRSLDNNNLPRAVYDALIKSTNANLPTLHRYFKLRAKMLGVAEMRYYDIYPPLVSGGREYPIDEGVRMMLESVRPLGAEYVAAMKKGVDDRWMDVYPRPRKQSGAHMAGFAYDVHPYVLMNYNNNYESVTTLAHEWGHAMHSYHSNKAQPFPTAGYAIYTAEIASTFHEALLLDYVLKVAKSDDERLLYLGSALETLRAPFFRQAMFADFEREVHGRVDRGEPLTGEHITKIYGDILR